MKVHLDKYFKEVLKLVPEYHTRTETKTIAGVTLDCTSFYFGHEEGPGYGGHEITRDQFQEIIDLVKKDIDEKSELVGYGERYGTYFLIFSKYGLN